MIGKRKVSKALFFRIMLGSMSSWILSYENQGIKQKLLTLACFENNMARVRRAKQTDFFDQQRDFAPRRHTHGGSATQGRRKLQRPLDSRKPVHLVLKSSHAKGQRSFLGSRNKLKIASILKDRAKQFAITLHSQQNVGNHIHVVASFKRREDFQNFLCTIAALIARHVTGARKGKPFGVKFWDSLAFTRVVMGRRDQYGLLRYVDKNRIEAEVSPLARCAVEEYEAAERKARRTGRDIWDILNSG